MREVSALTSDVRITLSTEISRPRIQEAASMLEGKECSGNDGNFAWPMVASLTERARSRAGKKFEESLS
uniref:CO_deh_flav_C domain-containing protein n=1 Tax=Steinernema glaseri TaxID=37863 RepID=A0A1I7XX59_9BILA